MTTTLPIGLKVSAAARQDSSLAAKRVVQNDMLPSCSIILFSHKEKNMRPLEILIPILLAVYLLWRSPRPLAIRLGPAAAMILVIVHFAVEGYRWQMILIYLLTLFLGMHSLLKINSSSHWRPLVSILLLI